MPHAQTLDDVRNLREHPFATAVAISSMRLAVHHPLAFKHCGAELGAADVNCQRAHALAAASTSSGLATPVPRFFTVMDATRLPKRAASIAEPVTARAKAAPAKKLSPAPAT